MGQDLLPEHLQFLFLLYHPHCFYEQPERCQGSSATFSSKLLNPHLSTPQTECRKMADQMSQLECSIETIINIFHQYSVRLEHPDKLNQKEMKQLVKKELPNFLKVGRGSRQAWGVGCTLQWPRRKSQLLHPPSRGSRCSVPGAAPR